MLKIVIGLVGETGSGKDTFCDRIKKTIKGPIFCFRFSDPLAEALRIFIDGIKKQDQQWLGLVLRDRFGNDILAKALAKKIEGVRKGLIILNGIRYWDEFKMIKKKGGKVIYITANSKLRWQRVRTRGEKKDDVVSYKNFLENEKSKVETFISRISKKADFRIENNGTAGDFYKKIDAIIKDIKQ